MRRLRVMWLHTSFYCTETLSNSSNTEQYSTYFELHELIETWYPHLTGITGRRKHRKLT